MRYIEPEDCTPENFKEATCYLCRSHDYCEEENIKHNYGLSKELQEHYAKLAEHYNKKARLQNGKG